MSCVIFIFKLKIIDLFVKWWNLTGEKVTKLYKKIKTKGKWRLEGDANTMWEDMAECIRRSAKEVLGVSKGRSGRMKGVWCWSKEVKEKVKEKQEKYKALVGGRMDEENEVNKLQYRIVKREAKKVVAVAKNNAYERLY